jgi:hypothetical protein
LRTEAAFHSAQPAAIDVVSVGEAGVRTVAHGFHPAGVWRDEKQLIGVGHAQVRAAKSAERVPAFAVACYSMLLISAGRAFGIAAVEPVVDRPKWLTQSSRKPVRLSTNQLVRRLKLERRDAPIDLPNFDHFDVHVARTMKSPKSAISLDQALQYALN